MIEESVTDMLDKQYFETGNKAELNYYAPLSKLIMESVELRDLKGMSQTDLAIGMNTRQSVISRFENMGRIPNYDFIARMSIALGHAPGVTLTGDYMAVVPLEKQELVKNAAETAGISTQSFLQGMLEKAVSALETQSYSNVNIIDFKQVEITDASQTLKQES